MAGSRLKLMCFIANETMRGAGRQKRRKLLLFNPPWPEVLRQNSGGCGVNHFLHLNSTNLSARPVALISGVKSPASASLNKDA